MRDAQLSEDARLVEVDALADDLSAVEDEERDHPARNDRPSAEAIEACRDGAEQVELNDHRIVAVAQGDSSLRWSGNAARVSA